MQRSLQKEANRSQGEFLKGLNFFIGFLLNFALIFL